MPGGDPFRWLSPTADNQIIHFVLFVMYPLTLTSLYVVRKKGLEIDIILTVKTLEFMFLEY